MAVRPTRAAAPEAVEAELTWIYKRGLGRRQRAHLVPAIAAALEEAQRKYRGRAGCYLVAMAADGMVMAYPTDQVFRRNGGVLTPDQQQVLATVIAFARRRPTEVAG